MPKPVLVIGAHLDDSVLGAGQFIAGRGGDVDVLTVFSGEPTDWENLTPYDEKCGFSNAKDAMAVRKQEDKEALAILNANPLYMNRLDSQYIEAGDYIGLAKELKSFIEEKDYEMVIAPLGLVHPDHIALGKAMRGMRLKNLYLYEDLPHRVTNPELVFETLPDHAVLTFIGNGDMADKVRALWCYKSQMAHGDLNPYNLYVNERFWKC